MNINNNSTSRVILALITVNSSMILLIIFSIIYSMDAVGQEEGIFGACFGTIFVILFDTLFFLIRKHLFSKVLLENDMLYITYFGKRLKQIKISDIKGIFVETSTIYLFLDKPQNWNIKSIQSMQKKPNTTIFKININKIGYFISQTNVNEVYYWKKINTNYKSEIEKYASVIQLAS